MNDNGSIRRQVLPIPESTVARVTPQDAREADRSEPAKPLRPPQGAPNVFIVLIDDMGFGASSAFGGPCQMPTAEKLRDKGLQYSRAHTTALCSPTRQALLTGRNHHTVNMGGIAEVATSMPGYTGVRPDSCATIARILKGNGYSTAAFGKMHQTPPWETSVSGPFDRWPTGDGFEKFYGFLGGETNQYAPPLIDGTTVVEPPKSAEEGYHLSEDMTDQAIAWVRAQQAMTPDKPFFIYYSFGATHAPHHVPKSWIDRFKGQFDGGWDLYREETFERQKQINVVPADAKLTPRPKEIPAWDSLEPDQKKIAARMMEAFAGFTAHTDHEVGRLLDALSSRPDWENTLVIYIVADNGASAEGGLNGTIDEISYYNGIELPWQSALPHLDAIGGPTLHNHFPVAWAWAMNTPFQWTKQVASHFGGTQNPMVVSWPARIKDKGGLRSQFHHVVDIVPTIYEVAGITPPDVLNGVAQDPIEGISIAYTFDDSGAKERHRTQYFEIYANRAIVHDGWCAASLANVPWVPQKEALDLDKLPWELYHIDQDFSESDDLAAKHPGKLRELQELWWAEAARNRVLPVDTRPLAARINPEEVPNPTKGLKSITYRAGVGGILEGAAPKLTNTSFTLTADLSIPNGGAEGMLFTIGGYTAGIGWYVQDDRLVFSYNYFTERTRIVSTEPLPSGQQTVRVEFAYDGDGLGKGATVRMYAGDKKIGEGRLDRTVPVAFSSFDGLDVGIDHGAPVDFTYKPPFTFTGRLDRVTVELQPAQKGGQ